MSIPNAIGIEMSENFIRKEELLSIFMENMASGLHVEGLISFMGQEKQELKS